RGYLGHPVASPHVLLDEASVTLLQLLQGQGWRQRGLRFRSLNSRGLLTSGVGGSLRESRCRDRKSKRHESHRECRSSHKFSFNVRIYHNTPHTLAAGKPVAVAPCLKRHNTSRTRTDEVLGVARRILFVSCRSSWR